jgi:hypothetical protein
MALRSTMLLLAMLAMSACAGADADRTATTARDSASIAIVENDLTQVNTTCPVGAAPTVTIGTAEGAPEQELYRVFGATRLSDGRIVIVNQGSQEIRFFDRNGKFLLKAGRAGEGPGEFRDAFYLWQLPGDTIWVGDYRPWQFHVFAPDGRFVRTVRPTPQYLNVPPVLAVLDDGRAVLATEEFKMGTTRFEPRTFTLVVHGSDGALRETIGTYENGRWGKVEDDPRAMNLYPFFESFARITAHGSRIFITHTSKPEVLIYDARDEQPQLERIVRFTTGDRTITAEHVAAEKKRQSDQYKEMPPDQRRRLVDPLISDKRPVAEQFPAFAGIHAGRDGRLWIREFTVAAAAEPRRWFAFDADGRFQCTATLPAFPEVLEFGADYLLAEQPDESGVERIVQYTLGAPVKSN